MHPPAKIRSVALLLAPMLWCGCAASHSGSSASPSLREPNPAPASIRVRFDGLDDSQRLSSESVLSGFGCTGQNQSPGLTWTAVAGAKSYALILHDPDAPTGVGFFHWVVLDLPPETTALPLGASRRALPASAIEAHTDFGSPGYGGPCPPPGQSHRYEVVVYAVDQRSLGLGAGATAALARFLLSQHTLALGRATATYSR